MLFETCHPLIMTIRLFYFIVFAGLFFACGNKKPKEEVVTTRVVQVPFFNGDSAYFFVAHQVKFGPRVPNTSAHTKNSLHTGVPKYFMASTPTNTTSQIPPTDNPSTTAAISTPKLPAHTPLGPIYWLGPIITSPKASSLGPNLAMAFSIKTMERAQQPLSMVQAPSFEHSPWAAEKD